MRLWVLRRYERNRGKSNCYLYTVFLNNLSTDHARALNRHVSPVAARSFEEKSLPNPKFLFIQTRFCTITPSCPSKGIVVQTKASTFELHITVATNHNHEYTRCLQYFLSAKGKENSVVMIKIIGFCTVAYTLDHVQ